MFSNPLAAMMDSDSESEDDNPLTAMGGPSKRAMQDSDDDSDDGDTPIVSSVGNSAVSSEEVEKLKKQIKNLNTMLDRSKFKGEQQKKELEKAYDDLHGAQTKLKESENLLITKERLNEDLMHENKRLQLKATDNTSDVSDVIKVGNRIQEFQRKIRIANESEALRVAQMQRKKRDEEELQAKKDEVAKEMDKLSELQQEISDARRHSEVEGTNQGRIDELTSQIAEQNNLIECKKKEMESAVTEMEVALEEEKKQREEEKERFEQEKQRLLEETEGEKEEIRATLMRAKTAVEKEKEEAEMLAHTAEREKADAQLKLGEQAELLKQLTQDMASLQASLAAAIESSEAKMEHARRKWEQVEDSYKEQVATLQNTAIGLEKTLASQTNDLMGMQRKLQERERECAELRVEASTLNSDLRAMAEEVDSMKVRNTALREGYLLKERGQGSGGPQRRYFIMEGHSLSYFKSSADTTKPLGSFRLTDASRFGPVEEGKEVDGQAVFGFAVQPIPAGRKYMLMGVTAKEREGWLAALQQHTPGLLVSQKEMEEDAPTAAAAAQSQCELQKGSFQKFAKTMVGAQLLQKHFTLYFDGVLKWGSRAMSYHQYKHSASVVGLVDGAQAMQMATKAGFKVSADQTSRLMVVETTGKTLYLVAGSDSQKEEWSREILVCAKQCSDKSMSMIGSQRGPPSLSRSISSSSNPLHTHAQHSSEDQGLGPVTGSLLKFAKGGKSKHTKHFALHPDGSIQWGDNAQKLKYTAKVVATATLCPPEIAKKLSEEQRSLFFQIKTDSKQLDLVAPSAAAFQLWLNRAKYVQSSHRDSVDPHTSVKS